MAGWLRATVILHGVRRKLNSWHSKVVFRCVVIPISLAVVAINCGCGIKGVKPQLSSDGSVSGGNVSGGNVSGGNLFGHSGRCTGTSGGSGGNGAGQAFTATGSMAEMRALHTATLLANGKVLVAGGDGYNGIPEITSGEAPLAANASAELYDPATGSFTETAGMDSPRYRHTATLLSNGKVLLAGGFSGGGTADLYDSVTGIFSPAPKMGTARAAHTATVLPNGTVLIAGGTTQDNFEFPAISPGISSAEVYDPGANSFAPTGTMGTARYAHTATLLPNGKVLVTGGFSSSDAQTSGTALSTAELYDPSTGAFTLTGSMATARGGHTATLLSNGKVLVAGGLINLSSAAVCVASSAELYDPATGTFAPTGDMGAARVEHTATRMPDGKVLLIGGNTSSDALGSFGCQYCRAQESTEFYDPVTGTFSFADRMTAPRSGHTATLLSDGRVLVAGGDEAGGRRDMGGSAPVASAEIFRLP